MIVRICQWRTRRPSRAPPGISRPTRARAAAREAAPAPASCPGSPSCAPRRANRTRTTHAPSKPRPPPPPPPQRAFSQTPPTDHHAPSPPRYPNRPPAGVGALCERSPCSAAAPHATNASRSRSSRHHIRRDNHSHNHSYNKYHDNYRYSSSRRDPSPSIPRRSSSSRPPYHRRYTSSIMPASMA